MPSRELSPVRLLQDEFPDPSGLGQPYVLRSYEPDEIRRWLKAMCQYSGMSATALANAAGVAPSTINRFLNNTSVKYRLSASTIAKIEQAAEEAYTRRVQIGYGQPDYPTYNVDNEDQEQTKVPPTQSLPRVRVIGYTADDEWRATIEAPIEQQFWATALFDDQHQGSPVYGLVVYSSAMNQVYPEGSVVFCVPIAFADRNPVPGERVVIERRRSDGMSEFTLREFQLDSQGQPWLWPRSREPEYQAPVRFDQSKDGDATTIVAAIVVSSLRPEGPIS